MLLHYLVNIDVQNIDEKIYRVAVVKIPQYD